MPRLVRRQPLWERITAMLNPMDFLLWLSEEIETREWNAKLVGTQLGLGLNFMFLLVQANTGSSTPKDDVFSEGETSGWLALCIYPLAWSLAVFSVGNAVYTISRTRKYRLFEANVEVKLSTPSARRVQVQSSPVSSSPLRYIADMITPATAEARAHPDKKRDVWELSVWDPVPLALRLLCFFSPGHVLIYLVSLPLAPLDTRPSVTVFNIVLVQAAMSAQLLVLSAKFSQQAKDSAILQTEVMHEYDKKFVHPRLHPVVRDVGTQISDEQPKSSREFVHVGTPTTLVRRSFMTNGNPYVNSEPENTFSSNVMRPQMFTPPPNSRKSSSFTSLLSQEKAAFRSGGPVTHTPIKTANAAMNTNSADRDFNIGGHMGIHTHSQSPLKRAISMDDMNNAGNASPTNSREMAAREQLGQRQPSSPIKRANSRQSMGMPSSHSTNSFIGMSGRDTARQSARFPTRW